MRNYLIFNLIANLIQILLSYPSDEFEKEITLAEEEEMMEKIKNLICDKIPLSLRSYSDILNICRNSNNFFFIKFVLYTIENCYVSIDNIIKVYNVSGFANSEKTDKSFECLNSKENADETGILILPKTENFSDENGNIPKFVSHDKESAKWSDEINSKMYNVFYVKKQEVCGYTLKNILLTLPEPLSEKNNLVIAATPMCNTPMHSLLDFNENIIVKDKNGNNLSYFGDVKLKDADKSTKMFLNAFRLSCRHGADILIGPEMFGTDTLFRTDEYGFNDIYEKSVPPGTRAPQIVVTPTQWDDNRNKAAVFQKTGELLCKQHKQHPFRYLRDDKQKCVEYLVGTPKEIAIIHVAGIGRITIPICYDFIEPSYYRILSDVLYSTLILCPSYSRGTRIFENTIKKSHDKKVRTVWINSCSAIQGLQEPPDYIGLVDTPIITHENPTVRLNKNCCENCDKGCLFIIKIPLDCRGSTRYEDINVTIARV